ncbi:MAG: PHP domain-containing protein [Desulfurococcaceae archaeon]|nr:PHP domain-containing protein [Desulfurococcaceae archaeon]
MAVRADLHIHSYVSDGLPSPRDIVRYAARVGLDSISITDHNTFLGSAIALRETSRVIVVPGAEFRTRYGDIAVLCESLPHILWRESNSVKKVSLTSLVDLTERENCVLVAVHPYAKFRYGIGSLYRASFIDCVEVFNSSSDPVTNVYTLMTVTDKLCRIAASDSHMLETVGRAYTLINCSSLSREEILESLRRGRVSPYYSLVSNVVDLIVLTRKRIYYSLRLRLGLRGDVWNRVRRYNEILKSLRKT